MQLVFQNLKHKAVGVSGASRALSQRARQKGHFTVPVLAALLLLLLGTSGRATAQTMPPGFGLTKVANIILPTCFAFAPDGRIFVCEQRGRVRIIKNGVLLTAHFMSLTVDFSLERGLVGIAFDPDFATNNYIYFFYTTPGPDFRNRVSRFTANGDVVVPGSEVVLLEIGDLTAAIHNGGIMRFGPDGKLYVSVGDGGTGSNAQSLDTVKGKILRINKDGTIPADNPFYMTATGNSRAIWCYGLRNPYTFAFQPTTSRLFINDVGNFFWEEINDGVPGGNYGWPDTEGPTDDPDFLTPIFAYHHSTGTVTGCAITGGDFYNPTTAPFPASYVGRYFFNDYCGGWVMSMDPDSHVVTPFVSGLNMSIVDLKTGPDGALYYVSRTGTNSLNGLYRIVYAPKSVSFHVTLEDCPSNGHQIEVELRPVNGGTVIERTITLNATGNVTISGASPIAYNMAVKGARWLRKVTPVNLTAGDVTGVQVTLTGGDANDDNSVDVLDLDKLIQSFDMCEGDSGFIPGADFDGNECVDVLDLDILIRNFDKQGDP
jgi:glucose/arabinose dehydrogenase